MAAKKKKKKKKKSSKSKSKEKKKKKKGKKKTSKKSKKTKKDKTEEKSASKKEIDDKKEKTMEKSASEKEEDKKSEDSKKESGSNKPTGIGKDTPAITSFSQLDAQSENVKSAGSDSEDESKNSEEKDSKEIEDKKEQVKVKEEKEEVEEKDAKKDKKEQISSDEVKEWLKDVRPDTTKEVDKGRGSSLKTVLIILIILSALSAVVGGIFYYRSSVDVTQETTSPIANEVPVDTATPTPTETPEDEIILSEYSVNVLNGSGTAGEAGRVAGFLTELGFEEPETGNAESFDFITTSVSMKEEVPEAVFDEINEALEEDYVVERADEPLEEDSSYDIIIIVGTRREG